MNLGTFSQDLKVPHSENWIDVDSKPGNFIVMGGEALQRLTNGVIYAAKHRVGLTGTYQHSDKTDIFENSELLLGDKERHSLAFFYDPNPEAILEPIEKFQVGGKKLYGAKLAGHKGVRRNL